MDGVPRVPAVTRQLERYAADALLRDGSSIHIRAIRADDKDRLQAHFHALSFDSVRYRFLGAKKDLTPSDLRYFTELDFSRHVGLVALQRHEGHEEFIGVGRYICAEDDRRRAEFALAVVDAWQGRGVGTLLMEHLARLAAADGVERFEAEILATNRKMFDVVVALGFRVDENSRAGVVHAWFPIEPTPETRRASDERAWQAAGAGVRALLHPRSVAVVGASRDPGSIGAALVANLVRHGFRGAIYPVNSRADHVEGLRAYPTLGAIGHPIDLVIVAVPAAGVEAVVEESARLGARGVVVISAGFAEVSEEGRAVQRRLRDRARERGLRLVGPNCMGVINTDPAVSLDATFAPAFPPPGNVGMLSQSGALGVAVLDYARALNIGVSTFVSVGNKADVSGNDLLAYWKDDPRTQVIALYLESFGNPRRFARLAPEVARRKPIVAVKSGRSAAGTRAASSHSAALACLDVAVDALFEQAGVIRTETLEDLFDVVSLLATQPVPKGPRVGVVTNAGGPGILLADACEARGLQLPELGFRDDGRATRVPSPDGQRQEPGGHDRVRAARATMRARSRRWGPIPAWIRWSSSSCPRLPSARAASRRRSPAGRRRFPPTSPCSRCSSRRKGLRPRWPPGRAGACPRTASPRTRRGRWPRPSATAAGGLARAASPCA